MSVRTEATAPRQQRAARTRERILDAAAVEFDECGYPGAKMARIVERAGVAKGAAYFHFPSKEDLARSLIGEQFTVLPPPSDTPSLQDLIDLTYAVAAAIMTNVRVRAAIRIVIEHASFTAPVPDAFQTWITVVSSLLQAADQRTELRDTVQVEPMASLIVGGFTGVQLLSEVLTGRKDLMGRLADLWSVLAVALVCEQNLSRYRWTAPAGLG